MKLKHIGKIACLGVIALLASCKDSTESTWQHDDKLHVVTTTTMITDMVKQIGGDKVEVKALMDHKIDPHGYEKTSADTKALNTADVTFYNGVHLEAKMQKGLENKASKGEKVYAVTSSIPAKSLLTAEGENDPHVWGDPKIWVLTIDVVLDGLIAADEANKDYYTKNAEVYRKEILAVDAWARKRVAELPEDKRVLITAHDAFQYFANSYGFEERALQGLSSADEASINAVTELTKFIKERGVKTIFAESTTNDKGIGAVAKDCGATVNNTPLYADACGPLGEIKEVNGDKYDVGTYTGMIKHNINTIIDALK